MPLPGLGSVPVANFGDESMDHCASAVAVEFGRMAGRAGETTCWTLVLGAAGGDREDRDAFVRRYEPVLSAYLAARWKTSSEGEEVKEGAQEVFLQCFRVGGALERLDDSRPGGFRAFLYGIARNVASEVEKKRKRHRAGEIVEEVLESESRDESPARAFDAAWARMLTHEARELLERRAEGSVAAGRRLRALDLCYGRGLPSRDIATEMGLTPEQVYPLLSSARKEFRGAFLEVLATYYPAASKQDLEEQAAETLAALGD